MTADRRRPVDPADSEERAAESYLAGLAQGLGDYGRALVAQVRGDGEDVVAAIEQEVDRTLERATRQARSTLVGRQARVRAQGIVDGHRLARQAFGEGHRQAPWRGPAPAVPDLHVPGIPVRDG